MPDIGKLIRVIQMRPRELQLDGQDKLRFEYEQEDDIENRVQWVKRLFANIAPVE